MTTGSWAERCLIPVGPPPFAGVVLVHGPGPNDRDESIYSNQVFRDLAEGLASRGIAVLRYDKRTKVYGEKMSELDFTLQQETVEDAVRAAALHAPPAGDRPEQSIRAGPQPGRVR